MAQLTQWQFLCNSVHNLDFSLLVCYKKYERLVQMGNEYVVSGTGRKDDPSRPDDEKPIQEIRRGTADIAGWLDKLEGLSDHGREQ